MSQARELRRVIPMAQIRKILFPVDFRYSCYGTARYLEALSAHFDAQVMLLHACTKKRGEKPEELRTSQECRLESFLAADLRRLKTERVCVAGNPATVIEATARSWKPDLIMLPSHGLGFFRRQFTGSVTAKVLSELSCPIWTSVHGEDAPSVDAIHFRRVLCSLDLEQHSEIVLRWAGWFSGQYGAELGVVHATEPIAFPGGADPHTPDFELQLTRRVRSRVDEIAAAAGTSVSRLFVMFESPAEAAREFDADLLIAGRHAIRSIPEDLFRNIYSIDRKSPCPVINI